MKSNKLKELLINSKTISFTIIIIVGVLAWVGNQQMKSYEDSILSIYAEQQDAYVLTRSMCWTTAAMKRL